MTNQTIKEILEEFAGEFGITPEEAEFIRKLLVSERQRLRELIKETMIVPAKESWRKRFSTVDEVLSYNQALSDVLKLLEE